MRTRHLPRLVLGLAYLLFRASSGTAARLNAGDTPVDLDVQASAREVIEENRSTTHERTEFVGRISLAVPVLPDLLSFESVTVGRVGGPTIKAQRSGVAPWFDVFQDISPVIDFEEFSLSSHFGPVDLRIGKQRVLWGKLDRASPNDLLNPLSSLDPFLLDEVDRKIGIPALASTYHLPAGELLNESRVSLVWAPWFLPYRLPTAECAVSGPGVRCDAERWFPPAALPPPTFHIPGGVLPTGTADQGFDVPLATTTTNGTVPARTLASSSVGARYAAVVRDVDVSTYYFHGFDPQPAFRLTAQAVGSPASDPRSPLPVSNLHGETTIQPEFARIHAWGADAGTSFGKFTVRTEAAYVRGRPFSKDIRSLTSGSDSLTPELIKALGQLARGAGRVDVAIPDSFVIHDSIEWGAGTDYLIDDGVVTIELRQTDVLRNHSNLLIHDVETRGTVSVRRSFLNDRIQAQFVASHGIESDYSLLRPRLLYRFNDHVAVEVGYLFFAGRSSSVVGQFKRNDEGWLRVEVDL